MSVTTYEDRLRSQIDQYAETIDMQAHPNIYFAWSHNYIAPGLNKVFGTNSIDAAYALAYTLTPPKREKPLATGWFMDSSGGHDSRPVFIAC